jgi:hypothetical protein
MTIKKPSGGKRERTDREWFGFLGERIEDDMIRITVEMVPFGIEDAARVIAKARIWNTGKGTTKSGNYKGEIYHDMCSMEEPWLTGEVKKFPRTKQNVWHLLYRLLQNMFE